MTKRKTIDTDESPRSKRQKITDRPGCEDERTEISSPVELQSLLAFEHDAGPRTRQKMQCFKSFLDSITIHGAEGEENLVRRRLLLDYLKIQTCTDDRESSNHLPDILRTWHFVTQANVESLMSSVIVVLVSLFKTISKLIEFREYGNRLCRFLLRDDEMKLFDRAFSANKTKEYLIAPALRLLIEVLSFDGANSAKRVYTQREVTFKRLEIFLGVRGVSGGKQIVDRTRPSVRNVAVQYLLTNLRLQNPSAKMEILCQGKLAHALFENLDEDPPDLIYEILDVLKNDVAMDGHISPLVKSRFLNDWVLSRLATLYSYPATDDLVEGRQSVRKTTHDCLLILCSPPELDILRVQSHYTSNVDIAQADPTIEKEESHSLSKTFHEDSLQQSRISHLASFLQNLRPYADALQCDLAIAVFRDNPELIGPYFSKKKSFSLDPKLTVTWVGYASFVLAVVQIPMSRALLEMKAKKGVPPSLTLLAESILPRPLTQRDLTHCLNQNTELIKFMTVKILVMALEKLFATLLLCQDIRCHKMQEKCNEEWVRVVLELKGEICERFPEMKHVIAQFRNCARKKTFLRATFARLLSLYYKLMPFLAFQEKNDISRTLLSTMKETDIAYDNSAGCRMHLLEFEHMLDLAQSSPDMKWWRKPDNMPLSPFMTLLKLYIDKGQQDSKSWHLKSALGTVATEGRLMCLDKSTLAFDILLASLRACKDWRPLTKVFDFLDNCILRLTKKPVYYYDLLVKLNDAVDTHMNVIGACTDLLLIAIVEQWPFWVIASDSLAIKNMSQWLARYFAMLWQAARPHDGATAILSTIRDRLEAELKDKECIEEFRKVTRDLQNTTFTAGSCASTRSEHGNKGQHQVHIIDGSPSSPCLDLVPPGPPDEKEDHPGLSRWAREDIQDAIAGGAIGELISCLCSKYEEIRKQAVASFVKLKGQLETSRYDEWQQTYLLIGEIVETAKAAAHDQTLPYFAGSLAINSLPVVADPLHFMYIKVNEFLNKGPVWNVAKLPSYWLDKVLLNHPTEDDAYYQELSWLLDTLFEGLRTTNDFDVYHRCQVFERLLSLGSSPKLPSLHYNKIVDILFRCTYVEGSSTLLTRCGLITWISSHLASEDKDHGNMTTNRLRILAARVYNTSEQRRVDDWSSGTILTSVNSLKMIQDVEG